MKSRSVSTPNLDAARYVPRLYAVNEDDFLLESSMPTQNDDVKFKPQDVVWRRVWSSIDDLANVATASCRVETRDTSRRNSAIASGFNVVSLIQGIGFLGVPFAVSQSGWACVITLIGVGIIASFTAQILIDTLYVEDKVLGTRYKKYKTYADLGQAVWPRYGKVLVNIVCVTELLGGCCLYQILMAKMATALLKHALPQLDMYYWSVIATSLTLPLLLFQTMAYVSWFSLAAVVSLTGVVVTVFTYCFTFANNMDVTNIPDFSIGGFPLGVGIVVFSYCAHAVFPSIEASMNHPEKYPTTIRTSFFVATVSKAAVGVLCVLLFGSDTGEEVTENMADNQKFTLSVAILTFVNVYFSIPLVVFVIGEVIEEELLPYFDPIFHQGNMLRIPWIIVTRAVIVFGGLFVAMIIPRFALLMSLIGSITGTLLTFIFPCVFQIVLKRSVVSRTGLVIRCGVIAFGIGAGLCGATSSMVQIVKYFSSTH